jgi:phosphatidylglycerophosphate synthase
VSHSQGKDPEAVILKVTGDEAAGARRVVAGLPVVERAIKQLGRLPTTRVTVASDGTIALPASLPANTSVRSLAGDPGAALAALQAELGQPLLLMGDVVRPQARKFDQGIRVVDEATRRKAEDAVFADLLRGDLGFVARHINKKVSFWFTRHVLCRLPVTPNQVTLGAGLLGLGGCALIASGCRLAMVAGFFLAQLQSILDGCDGELARVRFQQTDIGEWLDTIVDDVLNLALVGAIGVGLGRWEGRAAPMWWGLCGCAMLLTYNVIAYRELVKQGEGGEVLKIRWWWARGQDFAEVLSDGKPTSGFNLLVALGKRDFFVFAWLVLAALGFLKVVLVYAVVIAAIYFVVAIIQLVASPRPRPRAPNPG